MRFAQFTLISLILLVGGCGQGTYRALPMERDIPDLGALGDSFDKRPREMRRYTTVRAERSVDIAIHEIGPADARRIIVAFHGCPSSAETWRYLVGALGGQFRVLLVDLPGCGASDVPDPCELAPDGYSPDALAERVLQALDERLADAPDDVRVTLVGHSHGGTVVLRMMGDVDRLERHDSVAQRVDRLVLFAPLDVEFPNPSEEILELAQVSRSTIFLAQVTGILRQRLSEAAIEGVQADNRALREIVDWWMEIFGDAARTRAFQATLAQAVPWNESGLDWERVRPLVDDYANVNLPTLVVWGEYDEVLPVNMGYKLTGQLPNAALHVIPDCKHGMQLEYPTLCAAMVREFSESDQPLLLSFAGAERQGTAAFAHAAAAAINVYPRPEPSAASTDR